jgi:AcrR family transcriptional regulator
MGRPFNADAKATWRTIRAAGVRLLFKHGFEAMNLRQLAADSGLKPGSLYNYFESKNQFLSMILCEIMETILADLEKSVAPIEETRARLRQFIAFHIEWHTVRRVESFIGFMEMRNLSKADYKKYTALRKRYEDFLTDILAKGIKERKFAMIDPRITTFAILSMLTGAYVWYKKGGRLTQAELEAIYADLVFKMIDVEHAPARSRA